MTSSQKYLNVLRAFYFIYNILLILNVFIYIGFILIAINRSNIAYVSESI